MSDSTRSDSESSSEELDSHSTSGSSSTSSSSSNCGSSRDDATIDSVDEGSGGNDIDHPATVAEIVPTKATDPDPDPEGFSDEEAEEVLDEALDDENADRSIRNVQKQASTSYVRSLSTCHHVVRSELYTSPFPHLAVRIILCPES